MSTEVEPGVGRCVVMLMVADLEAENAALRERIAQLEWER